MRNYLVGAFLGLLVSGSVEAKAADLVGAYIDDQCPDLGQSALLAEQSTAALEDEVVLRMERAIAVADDPAWIASTSPAFVWASETKVACGKAYGYLQYSWRDGDYLAKCDCFFARMERYTR